LICRTTEVIDALERILLDAKLDTITMEEFEHKHSLLVTYNILSDCGFDFVSITDAHVSHDTN
jgi:hypothetical protein